MRTRKKSAKASAGAGWDHVDVMTRVANLKPSTTYHYRVVATNDSGTSTGPTREFTTQALDADPEFARKVVAEPTGRVRFKRPGDRWRPLPDWGAELPVGVAFDTRRGSIKLTSVGRRRASTQTGSFGGGVVKVRQRRSGRGRVDLYLRGGNFKRCGRSARAGAVAGASKVRRVRRLWGRDNGGRFRTHGRHSHATVRGTRWLTEDRCSGTFTRVTNGAVVVRDLTRRRNVVVRAGHSYLAPRGPHSVRRRH